MVEEPGKFPPAMAGAVVVANMIGTGVFSSLGFQLLDIRSGFVLLMLWVVGGLTALCGALTYAELGAALPRSGGEYNFLTEIYHPVAGFTSGWISATIGFAAPTALAAITFGTYLSSVFPGLSPAWLACTLVIALTLVHAINRNTSGSMQLFLTGAKLLLIGIFCLLAWFIVKQPQPVHFLPESGDAEQLFSGAFAISLIYVNYAYTGWNAATYLSGEIRDPQKYMPRILIIGTALVMTVYVALNFIFLYVAPMDEMVGKIEIGYVAARFVFGETGGAIMGVILSLLLISTVSAMIIAGPRVLQVIGQDFRVFRLLARNNKNDIPAIAILIQAGVTLVIIVTGSFESILVFSGFTLGVNSLITVTGIFVLRWRQPDLARPYRTWLYPLPPLIYLIITGWTLAYILYNRPDEAWQGIIIIASGTIFYLITVLLGRYNIAGRDTVGFE